MSDIVKLTAEQKTLIEKLAVLSENNGMQPAAARIMALLMVSDITELTFDQIRETLNISKSATSNAINLLITTGKVEYVSKLGDRKRYFRTRLPHWKEDMKIHFEKFGQVNALMKEVLKQRPKNTPEFNQSLKDIIDFLEYLQAELPGIYKRWEAKRRSR